MDTQPKALVLYDSDKIAKVIKLILEGRVEVHLAGSLLGPWEWPEDDVDMGVLLASAPTDEPALALAKDVLAGYIGRVPLLIISDGAFEADPGDRITHLGFPFTIDGLRSRVQEMLQLLTV